MKYILRYDEKVNSISRIISNVKNIFRKGCKFDNNTNEWSLYVYNGIELKIQPNFESNDFIDKNLSFYLGKVNDISKRYFLIRNSCELYANSNARHIKFRLSDSKDESDNRTEFFTTTGDIPYDIKLEINTMVRNLFKGYKISIDDFPERGYVLYDIIICL